MSKKTISPTLSDDSLLEKVDGSKLKFWQLKSDFQKHLLKNPKSFLNSPEYIDKLPDIIVRFLGRKKILDWGEQVAENKKKVFDALYEEFKDPQKIIPKEKPVEYVQRNLFR